ncbi:Ribosome biogenesis protein BOP1-like protein [Aphelenchoides besseyi]|nr:Ribosome biogenesis protein BOP1-like protein [Aphelenchoides besseyi]KAI6218942.1 Ribosome biogenesis protein BOP1-like protein [Aphelenchoides besseyi]
MSKRKSTTGSKKQNGDVEHVDEKTPQTNGKIFQENGVDSDDEADLRNTIGNIPIQWYEDYDHIGYDLSGKRIAKPEGGKKRNEIDEFLEKMDDPDYWRRVFDQQTGADVTLTDEQVEKLTSMSANRYPDPTYNPYEPFYDIFSHKKEIHPISNKPEDKRSFIPSESERKIVARFLRAMQSGRMKPKEKAKVEESYDLWASEDNESKSKRELARLRTHCPAPKMQLPVHAESYNPPAEYLMDKDEQKKWEESEPETRRLDFIPQKFDALRKVPFYERFYRERFERCMDLYLAPRQIKMKLNVDAKDLLPDLPNPQDLQPFPTTLGFYMRGHVGQVRSLSVESGGSELLVSGGEDATVRVWYIPTGRCLKIFKMSAPVTSVAYSPNPEHTLVLVACEDTTVTLLNVEAGDKLRVSTTREFLANLDLTSGKSKDDNDDTPKWTRNRRGNIEITMSDKIRQASWHRKGDFFATVGFTSSPKTVYIHRISTCSSQKPFSKPKGQVQQVLFHPTKPQFFVATMQYIRLYDLAKCTLLKKISTGTKWLSSIQLDPHGNNIFVSGLDRVFSWIDLELSNKPWKTLRSHSAAVRGLSYHRKYPLLATVSDDATAIVYHARCPQDFTEDNELVPVKRLFGHKHQQEEIKKDKEHLAILSTVFHPTLPWLITGGADGQIGVFIY